MQLTDDIDRWSVKHHPSMLEYLRIALGLFILYKGIVFIQDTTALENMMANSQFEWGSFGLAHIIAFAHLAGGPMIAMGLKTRFVCIVHIPILIGAVFFSTFGKGIYTENWFFIQAIITLILLVFYAFYGSGVLSMDHRMRDNTHDILY
jgi:putative oxidoreductase